MESDIRQEIVQMVTVRLGAETYGIPIHQIHEIVGMADITRIPGLPSFISGVINLRGRIIPVLGLRQRFGLGHRERGDADRIVVVEIGDQTVGLEVDSVSEVVRLPRTSIEAVPQAISQVGAEYLAGVATIDKGLIILLNVDRIITESEKTTLESIPPAEAPPKTRSRLPQ